MIGRIGLSDAARWKPSREESLCEACAVAPQPGPPLRFPLDDLECCHGGAALPGVGAVV